MSLLYHAPRGTRDLLPEDRPYWDRVESVARSLCSVYGFKKIDTPTFEDSGLFIRSIGQGTDIVDKEMYSFQDKGNHSLTLRSEGTAPVVRAYLERGMHVLPQPVKLFYLTSIFRYDRPQAGRYREHRQFGVEAIGETEATLDAEVISLAYDFYKTLSISGITLQLNNIGDRCSRKKYLSFLIAFYQDKISKLCGDCIRRLNTNPLRLFDCKVESCRKLLTDAPKITDHLSTECEAHFHTLRSVLDGYGIAYSVNPLLVRGLDYYTNTVFEFWAEGIGAQNAVGGGGRYDGLAESLGGSNAPGIGFGIGLDRVILTMLEQGIDPSGSENPQIFMVSIGSNVLQPSLDLIRSLRQAGLRVSSTYGNRSMKSQMRQANASQADFTLILGEEELVKGSVACRKMDSGEQVEIDIDGIVSYLHAKFVD